MEIEYFAQKTCFEKSLLFQTPTIVNLFTQLPVVGVGKSKNISTAITKTQLKNLKWSCKNVFYPETKNKFKDSNYFL